MKTNDLGQGALCSTERRGTSGNSSWRRRLRLIRMAVLVVVLMGMGIVWYSGLLDSRLDEFLDSAADSLPTDGRPAFVPTAYASWEVPRTAPLKQRLFMAYLKFREKWGRKNPAAYRFPPSPVQLCSVQGLLDECMQVTGTRYLIAREALGWTVDFGHTNTLNGSQWVAAFEQTLRADGLLLLTNKPGVVKVIPRSKLQDYRKAGLVKNNE